MVELVACQSHQTPSSRRCIQAPSCEQAFQDLYLEMIQSQSLLLGRVIPILPFDTNPAPSIILLSGLPPRIGDTIHFALHPPSHPLSNAPLKTPSGVREVWAFLLSFLMFSYMFLNMC
jgi:hypothetical protein